MAESDWVDESPGDWVDEPVRAEASPGMLGRAQALFGKWADKIPLGKAGAAMAANDALQFGRLFGLGEPGAELTDRAKAELRARNMPVPDNSNPIPSDWGQSYRQLRKEGDARIDDAARKNPLEGFAGSGLGIATTLLGSPALRVLGGTGAVAGAGNALLTGALYNGLAAADRSNADPRDQTSEFLDDVTGGSKLAQAYADAKAGHYGRALLGFLGAGAAGGAGTGLLLHGAAEGVKMAGGSQALRRLSIRKGKDVLQGGSDIAAATRKPLSDDAVEEVLRSDLMGGTTAETYKRIEGAAATEGQKYADIVSQLEARGVKGPDAKVMAERFLKRAQELEPNTYDDAVVQLYRDAAERLGAKAPQRAALPTDYPEELRGLAGGMEPGDLGLAQNEGLKQSAQKAARLDRLKNSSTEEVWEDIGRMHREGSEDAINRAMHQAGPDSDVARIGQDFVPTKQRLSRLLEARTAAEKGAVKAAAKPSGPGLPDLLMGLTTGDPATAYITALASKSLRSRAPSILARGAYGVFGALENGTAGASMARLPAALEMLRSQPSEDERARSLAAALRSNSSL